MNGNAVRIDNADNGLETVTQTLILRDACTQWENLRWAENVASIGVEDKKI
jgi:hypothetical protein